MFCGKQSPANNNANLPEPAARFEYPPHREVRVGLYENKPKIFTDESGNPAGIFIDILEAIAEEEGWELSYVPCNWPNCLDALQKGEIDLMPDVAFSPSRDSIFDFHNELVVESWSRVYIPGSGAVKKLSELDGHSVALLQGSIQQKVMEQMINGFGYEVEFILTDSYEEALSLAADGKADAAVANHFFGDYYYREYGLEKSAIVFNPVSLYFATAEGQDIELLAALDENILAMKTEPGSPYYKTLEKWLNRPLPPAFPLYLYWIIGLVLGGLALAAIVILVLRRQVGIKTKHLYKTKKALRESEIFNKAIMDNLPVGIAVNSVDPSVEFYYMNDNFPKFYRTTREALKNPNAFWKAVYTDEQFREKIRERVLVDCATGELARMCWEDIPVTREGKTFFICARNIPIPETNLMISTVWDVTERKENENQIHALKDELQGKVRQRTAELQTSNEELEAFAYSVSHDLRAPLRSIDGFSKAVLQDYQDKLDETGGHYLKRIRAGSQRMGTLIDDILQLSRITRHDIRYEEVNLTKMANQIVKELQETESERQVDIKVQEGLTAEGDPRLLNIMLENLLGNAWKFSAKQERAQIRFGTTDKDGEQVFFVKDNGVGFDMKYTDKLFGAFQRLHTQDEFDGTGIGLATVKKVINRHGEKVWATGEVNKGATFYFTL